jgi:hypothetical protein
MDSVVWEGEEQIVNKHLAGEREALRMRTNWSVDVTESRFRGKIYDAKRPEPTTLSDSFMYFFIFIVTD